MWDQARLIYCQPGVESTMRVRSIKHHTFRKSFRPPPSLK